MFWKRHCITFHLSLLLALRLMLRSKEKTPTGLVTRWGFFYAHMIGGWVVSDRPQGAASPCPAPATPEIIRQEPPQAVHLLLPDVRRCGRPARRRRFSLAGWPLLLPSGGAALALPQCYRGAPAASPAPLLIKAAARVGRCALRAALLDRVGAGRAYQRACACPAGAYARRNGPSTGPSTARPAAA